MIRYPKGYIPGIPTLSRAQEAKWMTYALAGKLHEYLDNRGNLEVDGATLVQNAREIGLTDEEIIYHVGREGAGRAE